MGRKNKIKMNKGGSPSASPGKVKETMKESLRELIGNVPAEANQKLQLLLSELEKKSLELGVAKECIKQLQQEKPFNSFRGDGDSPEPDSSLQESIRQNQGNISNLEEFHVAFTDEWKSIGKKVENLSGDCVVIEGNLDTTNEDIAVLRDKIKVLESDQEIMSKSFEKAQQAAAEVADERMEIINRMESDLLDAKSQVCSLRVDIDKRDLAYSIICSDLQSEKERRAAQEKEIAELTEVTEITNDKLRDSLREASTIQNQIIHLAFALREDSDDYQKIIGPGQTGIENYLRQHSQGEATHIENVSDGIFQIKTQFAIVKTELSKLRKQNEYLHQRMAEADTEKELNREKSDEYCSVIKGLQKESIEIKRSNEAIIAAAYQDFDRMKQKLEDELISQKAVASRLEENCVEQRNILESIKTEFEKELDSGTAGNVLEAIRQLKDNYQTVKVKHESEAESLAATGNQLIDAKNELSGKLIEIATIEQNYKKKMDAEKVNFDEKYVRLEEELSSSKNMVKKVRKEKDTSTKKWKRRVDDVVAEKDLLAEQNKELEEKLSELSDTSIRDESFRSMSEQSDAYRSQCEGLQKELTHLKTIQEENDKEIQELSEALVKNDRRIMELNRTIVAQKSTIDSHDESVAEKNKRMEKMEVRMMELLRSTETMQKRHDEDYASTCLKLKTSESELEALKKQNLQLTASADSMQKKHDAQVGKLTDEIEQLNKTIGKLSTNLDDMRKSRVDLVKSMELKIQQLESEKQKAVDELVTCNLSLTDAVEKATNLEKELARIEVLEKKKTEVLVALTEEEKAKIREEKDSVLLQLEAAQKNLKQQKADAKKVYENDIRKLKKVIKTVEEQKNQALEEVSEVTVKLEETKQLQLETSLFVEEEEKKHKRMMTEFEELQKSVEEYRAKHKERLDSEKSIRESLQSQVLKQDLEIERLSDNAKLGEKALEEMAQLMERKDEEHEAAIEDERKKIEILEKALKNNLDQVEQSLKRQLLLDQSKLETEKLRKEYETSLRDITSSLEQKEKELEKRHAEMQQHSSLGSELENLKKIVREKDAIIVGMNKQKSDLESEKSELETEINTMSKQLADSPKKVIQLENRLGVIQSAASAQYKRLEEDFMKSNKALEDAQKNNAEFQELFGKKSEEINELTEQNMLMRSQLSKAEESEATINKLHEEVENLVRVNQELDEENKKERAGLVDELIATKQKMGEYEKLAAKQRSDLEHMLFVEQELKAAAERNRSLSSVETVPSHDNIDEMFPTLDPAVRQLLRLLSNNRNFAYGMTGFVVYAALIHLYVLL